MKEKERETKEVEKTSCLTSVINKMRAILYIYKKQLQMNEKDPVLSSAVCVRVTSLRKLINKLCCSLNLFSFYYN